ncbi:MAG: TetR family transcriptional regulator C-terminal domain-containing protein [Clostridia bacterium]|nr:TetR family transcriptional regulator C-terminal domain-containing protein [Clostridia bacterium]
MKAESKNAILKMLSDDATATELCDTAEDFTWVFEYVKSNAQQLRTRFKAESYNTTGDYKTAFFVHGLRAIIATWLDHGCADSPERMNEIVIKEYKKLFSEK